jgi:hypothetical protein
MVANILEECTAFAFGVALLSWAKEGRGRKKKDDDFCRYKHYGQKAVFLLC